MADLIGYGGNASIFLTDDGVILIDSKSDREHDDLIAKIKSLTNKPVKYVILTHNHADHTGGVPKLEAMGVSVHYFRRRPRQHASHQAGRARPISATREARISSWAARNSTSTSTAATRAAIQQSTSRAIA